MPKEQFEALIADPTKVDPKGFTFKMIGADGSELGLVVDADFVDDPMSDVKCILAMRRENALP